MRLTNHQFRQLSYSIGRMYLVFAIQHIPERSYALHAEAREACANRRSEMRSGHDKRPYFRWFALSLTSASRVYLVMVRKPKRKLTAR